MDSYLCIDGLPMFASTLPLCNPVLWLCSISRTGSPLDSLHKMAFSDREQPTFVDPWRINITRINMSVALQKILVFLSVPLPAVLKKTCWFKILYIYTYTHVPINTYIYYYHHHHHHHHHQNSPGILFLNNGIHGGFSSQPTSNPPARQCGGMVERLCLGVGRAKWSS